jgi:uncharacterized protein (TIGR02466 family)
VSFEVYNMFPAPVATGVYSNNDAVKETLIPKFKEYEQNVKCENYWHGGYTSYGTDEGVLYWDECKDLIDFIGSNVANFHSFCGLKGNVGLQNSWFSINRRHALHEKHNHLPSTWSGVYYIQCDEEDSGITFVNKHLDSNWPYCERTEPTEYNSGVSTIQPQSGSLVIFPSYLDHKVEQQTTDNERITIAFNFGVINEQ